MTEINANYDEVWKEAITDYFQEFLQFFFPQVYQLINWQKTPVSLEKELQKITADSDDSKRFVDKLYQVWLKNQQQVWILIHIEVQSQKDADFAQRMFIYHYRAFDLYRKPVVSLAILGDEVKSWLPTEYSYKIGGCELKLTFPSIKLLDYYSQWQELETNLNPFAMMIMAHLKTKSTTSNLTEREQWKWLFIRSLYEKGYQKKEIIKLLQLIDVMMALPPDLQSTLNTKIEQYEEERKMPLMSNIERMALERGTQKAINPIIRQLNRKFSNLSPELETQIRSLPIEKIEDLAEALLDFNQLEDLISWLENYAYVLEGEKGREGERGFFSNN